MKFRQINQSPKTFAEVLCLLVLIGITTMLGYSQAAGSDYASPSDAIPKGKAPKMRVQLLNPGEPTKQYTVIFYQGRRGLFRTSGVCREVSRYQCALHRYWSTEWSNARLVRSPAQNVQENSHQWSARSDCDERRYRALSRKTRGPYSHGGGESRRNNAGWSRSRGVCVPDAGSNGYSRSSSDAKAV